MYKIFFNVKMLSFLVVSIFFLTLKPAFSGTHTYDDFSGNIINTTLWSIGDSEGIFIQTGGYLQTDSPPNLTYSSLDSKKIFSGNFEIVINYEDFMTDAYLTEKGDNGFPAIDLSVMSKASPQNSVAISRCQDYQGGSGGVFLSGKVENGIDSDLGHAESSTSSGQMKIQRIGSNITTFFNEGSGWVSLGNNSNIFTDDVYIRIAFTTGANGTYHAKIDGIYYNENQIVPLFYDSDGDGYGNASNSIETTSNVAGYVSNSNDCDDSDGTIHPDAKEICWDGIDQDCDGSDKTFPLLPDTITQMNNYPSGVDSVTFINEVSQAWDQIPNYASQESLKEKWDAAANANECCEGFSYPDILPIPNEELNWESAAILGKLYPYRNKNNFPPFESISEKPEPFVSVQIDANIYAGPSDENIDKTVLYLSDMLNAYDDENQEQSIVLELKNFLIEFAQANALSEGLWTNWPGDYEMPVHFSVMAITPFFIHAFDLAARYMSVSERTIVGTWLNRLIGDVLKSSWWNRQDNKAYFRSQIALDWGIITGDATLIANAITMFKHAINEMRPDGSFPNESSRGGSANFYQFQATESIMAIANGLNEHFGFSTYTFTKDNKTVWTAVSRVLDAVDDPVKIASEYGKDCPGGSSGSVDEPGDYGIGFLLVAKSRTAPDDTLNRINKLKFENYPMNGREGIDFRSLLGTDIQNKLVAHNISLPTLLNKFRGVVLIRRPDIDLSDTVNLYAMTLTQDGSFNCRNVNGWENYNCKIPSIKTSNKRIIAYELFNGTEDLSLWQDTILLVGAAQNENELISQRLYYPVLNLSNNCPCGSNLYASNSKFYDDIDQYCDGSGGPIMSNSTISASQNINTPIQFTINDQSDDQNLNYRFSMHPNYGNSGYDGLNWQSLTSSEWTTDNSIAYTFTKQNKYIVVVWAAEDTSNIDSNGIPIAGWSMDLTDETCKTIFTGYDISGNQRTNSPVTFTVNAANECSDNLYYRFSVHPDYGTDGYDGIKWKSMTSSEWISNNSTEYTFTEAGKYIIVVWVTDDSSSVDPNGIPIIGWSVDIE